MLDEWAVSVRKKCGNKQLSSSTYLSEAEPFLEQYAKRRPLNQALIDSAGNLVTTEDFFAIIERCRDEEGDLDPEREIAPLNPTNTVKESVCKDEGLIVFFPGRYWMKISEERRKKPYSILLPDKNAPNEEVWRQIEDICHSTKASAVPVVPDSEGQEQMMENCSSSTASVYPAVGSWNAKNAIAGSAEALQALRELITYPLLYFRESQILGLKWPRGLLLFGPPGTGKTSLVRAVVRECDAHLIVISPHSVHRSHAGESEKILRDAFAEAKSHATFNKPSVIFIDEIDALCPRRDSRREQDVRVASQLFVLMDSNKLLSFPRSHVVVVAATNRVDSIDPALRRSGRFDAEVEVSTPNEEDRFQILKLYSRKLCLDSNVDLRAISTSCNGYVGADLEALCREATLYALNKCSEGGQCIVSMDDWKHAKSVIGPSITRGLTVEIPKVSWDDVGGLKDLKKKLQQAVEWPLKYSLVFSRMGMLPIRGILLHGPPGCSKTTIAKAAASAAKASFFSLSGAELYSMYVGEGESLLRNTFRKARLASPSIIFFDEADVVAAKRGGSSSGSSVVGERLLSTLLTEMDGLEQAKGILVLAATNRPYAIDAALLRPGRFDLVLYVPPPDLEARHEILQVHTRNMIVDEDVDLRQIAEDTELFTGAEVEGLCREAGIVALREDISASVVSNRHFQAVMRSLKPALSREEIDKYASFSKNRYQKVTSSSLSSTQQKRNGSKSKWLPLASLTFGIISLVLYSGLRYITNHY